jgi:hypothetical protein
MILTQVYQATPYSLAPLCGHSTRVSRVGSAVRIILDRPAHALDRLLRAVAGSRRRRGSSRKRLISAKTTITENNRIFRLRSRP